MMNYSQNTRDLIIHSQLPDDALIVHTFSGTEGLSRPFHYEVQVLCNIEPAAARELMGQAIYVTMRRNDGTFRSFHGHVNRMQSTAHSVSGKPLLNIAFGSWFYLLNMRRDCRLFQHKSTLEILEELFSEANMGDFEIRAQSLGSSSRIFTVQYRETTFDFANRLMEEEGLFYFFEHSTTGHTLVIADSLEHHLPCPNQDSLILQHTATSMLEEDTIHSLHWQNHLTTDHLSLSDYNFEAPNTNLRSELGSGGYRESYDYPGGYQSFSQGDSQARLRLESHLQGQIQLGGSGSVRSFSAGHRFHIFEGLEPDMEPQQILLTVKHKAQQPLSLDGPEEEKGVHYQNTFTCFPYCMPYRPPRKTEKPIVKGTQTAIVVGPKGEEIYTDKYGRVKIQFHWDRFGAKDENSSCWVRVSHSWAGQGWGSVFTPRIGQEVIVDFLEGNPDRPIIIGRVYNAAHMPPYTLPRHQTRSGIKSNSSQGSSGSNEIRLEDRAGREEFYTHAQKERKDITLANHTEEIGENHTYTVQKDQSGTIEHNRQTIINTGDDLLHVKEGKRTVSTQGDERLIVKGGHRSVTVEKGDYRLTAKNTVFLDAQNEGLQIRGEGRAGVFIKGTGTAGVQILGEDHVHIVGNTSINMNSDMRATIQSSKIELDGQQDIHINAPKIILSSGPSFIKLTNKGIVLSGPIIKIN